MTTVLVKKYNPLEMSKEDVLALATGREKLLDIMLSEMKVCLKNGSNQHFVLHGPRGIGKSFFTRLLKIHHDQSDDFKNSLFLQLPEEQENINFTADLLDVIATLLEGGKLIDTAPKWSISDSQWQKSKQRLKEAINEVKKNGTLHVFVTQENLQAFIPKLDKIESSRLREFLSDFDEVTIVGSSLRPDLDNDYSKRLFQVFKKLDIEPWTSDDFLTYYDKLAQRSNYDKEQLDNLKKSKNKIKAISQFTGGSPRLAVILSKLIFEKNILDTAQLLDGIIDELTTYYQDITNDIPAKSKILFDMLIRKGENMTQSTLASSFEPPLEQKDIARSFAWLTDNYYVVSSKQARGNTKYFYVRDRLYVLYYQKRQVYADVPFSFVGVFVEFLIQFYSVKERKKELQNLDLEHPYTRPILYHMALNEGILCKSDDDPALMRENILSKFDAIVNKNDGNKEVTKIIEQYHSQAKSFYDQKLYDQAIEALSQAIKLDPNDATAYNNVGNTMQSKGDFEGAILQYQQAIKLNPKNAAAYNNLGAAMYEKGDFEGAILQFEQAIKFNPKYAAAYNNLGAAKQAKGDIEEAILQYHQATKLNPKDASAYYNLGSVMTEKGDFEGAILQYYQAIKLNPKDAAAYNNLGNAMQAKRDLEGAILQYHQAIKLNPAIFQAYLNLGIIYYALNEYEKAHEIFLKALNIEDDQYEFPTIPFESIITTQQWHYISQYTEVWHRTESISAILGKALYQVVKENPEHKFLYFKKTMDTLRPLPTINHIEVVNSLCIGLYKDGDMDFLRQVVDELSHDFADDAFVKINLEVYKYLLDPERMDINQLHPDVRTVVESIIQDKVLEL